MNPLAALCFIFVGLSLWELGSQREQPTARALPRLLAQVAVAAVVIAGLLRFSEVLFGWHIGLDQILFRSALETAPGGWHNRMAPNTALNFVLLGAAILLLDAETRRGRRPAQYLALAAGVISTLALVGYAYGVSSFYAFPLLIPMALTTAVGFLLLSLAVLCARPEAGITLIFVSDTYGGSIARRLLPAALGLPVVLGWLRWEGEDTGFYGTQTGIALYTTSMIVILGLAVWLTAHWLDQADRGRRHVQRELDSIFGLSLDLLCIAGFDGYFKRLNPAWAKTLGHSEEELLARPYLDFVHPDDREPTLAESARIAQGATTLSFENRYRAKDGSYRWFLWTATPDLGQGLIFAAARDITERRRAEQALRESEARFRRLLEAAPATILGVDSEGRIVFLNALAEKTFGYDREELLGQLVELLVPDRFRQAHPGHRAAFAAVPQTRLMGLGRQLWARRKDGSEFPVEVGLSPIKSEDDFLVMILLQDITERKRAEQALQELNRELEAFTYSVSHDLRAPLRHIDGFSQMLSEDFGSQLPEDAQRYLARIRAGTRQMGQLVDDLLNLARVGRQELRLQVTGLTTLVEGVRRELQAETEGRQVEWEVGSLPFVECDPALMKQVFANLLSNALKYSRPRSQARIQVGQLEQNGHPVIFVRDNGVGFSMKYADKLFGVFQRLHRAEDFEGTGVGLATVQRIIHKHRGQIWAEAELDKGATFYFSLGNISENAPTHWPDPRGDSWQFRT